MSESPALPPPGCESAPVCFKAVLPATQSAIGPVRRRLRGCLEESGLARIADDVALAATELMTNAVIHGCHGLPSTSEVTLTAAWTGERLRIAVDDPSDALPAEQESSVCRDGGRGLTLVDALSDRWGVEPGARGTGKSVWLELDLAVTAEECVA
ncbi:MULTISPECIES: ATP-binding protein [Streptomyces]|uniref:ATP-binding protein n=1 Tax=Streptomyces TaxID=1883 RepID=UPI002E0E7D12|nr:ATP-binding protein [Streptomyces subrutilus]